MGAAVAIVAHPSRGPIDIDLRTAEQVVQGKVDDWGRLGQPSEALTSIVTGPIRHRLRVAATDSSALAVVPLSRVDPRVRVVSVGGVDPLAAPGRYGLGTPASAQRPLTVTIVGDIMMARGVATAMGDDEFASLRQVASGLREADLTIGNLESSLSQDGPPLQGGDSFGADPEVLDAVERAGVDVLSLANNHVGDYGVGALRQTLDAFDDSPMLPVGAGKSLAQAQRPVIVDVGGTRVGVLAFNAIGESPAAGPRTPGVIQLRMPPRTGPLSTPELRALTRSVERLGERTDIVVVLPHWGEQYTRRPLPVQRLVARRLVDAGATAVIGGHPHWVQGMEIVDDSVVAYSLGNFVFDMDFSTPTMQGIALDLTFWGSRLMAVTPRPVQISPTFVTRFVDGRRATAIEDDVWRNGFGSWAS